MVNSACSTIMPTAYIPGPRTGRRPAHAGYARSGRARPVQWPAAALRPAGGDPVLRPEPPLAARDGGRGGAHRPGRGPGARRGHRHRRGRAALDRSRARPGHRRGPDRADAAARPGERGQARPRGPDQAAGGPRRAAALPGRQLRRRHLHLSAALRRGSGGDARRTGPGAQARRRAGQPGVRGPGQCRLARGLGRLHPRRAAGGRDAHRRARVGARRQLPRPLDQRPLPRAPGREHRRILARRRDRGRAHQADEPRRRPGHVGPQGGGARTDG
jgi:hypothetical protein